MNTKTLYSKVLDKYAVIYEEKTVYICAANGEILKQHSTNQVNLDSYSEQELPFDFNESRASFLLKTEAHKAKKLLERESTKLANRLKEEQERKEFVKSVENLRAWKNGECEVYLLQEYKCENNYFNSMANNEGYTNELFFSLEEAEKAFDNVKDCDTIGLEDGEFKYTYLYTLSDWTLEDRKSILSKDDLFDLDWGIEINSESYAPALVESTENKDAFVVVDLENDMITRVSDFRGDSTAWLSPNEKVMHVDDLLTEHPEFIKSVDAYLATFLTGSNKEEWEELNYPEEEA